MVITPPSIYFIIIILFTSINFFFICLKQNFQFSFNTASHSFREIMIPVWLKYFKDVEFTVLPLMVVIRWFKQQQTVREVFQKNKWQAAKLPPLGKCSPQTRGYFGVYVLLKGAEHVHDDHHWLRAIMSPAQLMVSLVLRYKWPFILKPKVFDSASREEWSSPAS